jgi:DNA sulfur modification protein DndE
MNLNKIKISIDATQKLKTLKTRTGLTPNILCRIGFCLSLNEHGIPDTSQFQEDGIEFNRYTLTGKYDTLFVSLLKERCIQDGVSIEDNIAKQFLGHLNRGILLIFNRIKNLSDMKKLI